METASPSGSNSGISAASKGQLYEATLGDGSTLWLEVMAAKGPRLQLLCYGELLEASTGTDSQLELRHKGKWNGAGRLAWPDCQCEPLLESWGAVPLGWWWSGLANSPGRDGRVPSWSTSWLGACGECMDRAAGFFTSYAWQSEHECFQAAGLPSREQTCCPGRLPALQASTLGWLSPGSRGALGSRKA